MTPLLGTKNPSALVGAKSGGDGRAARSLLSCALWSGMGRLWGGMGGMGRPEPLSAHRPHRQQRLSGFHETRHPRPETRLLPGARRKPARIPRFSRITNHETRITAFMLSCALWRGMGRLWGGMGGMGRPEPLSAHRPHRQQGLSGFHETRDPRPETRLLPGAPRKPARIPRFSRITKHETRITAFMLSCALWRGMGRLWGGMGGMGRPEPLSAHRPHRQQGLSGFHETRDPRPETRLLPGARRKPARIPRFSRITETRITAFSRITAFFPCRQAHRLQGGCTKRGKTRGKRFFLNPETGITTYTESGFGSRFGISHNIPQCVGKIRISPCRQSSAPEHRRHRLHGCIKSPRNRPWPAGLAKWRGEGPTGQETRIKALHQVRGASQREFRGFHETRNTNHGLFSRASTVGW